RRRRWPCSRPRSLASSTLRNGSSISFHPHIGMI
ncbi:MAG: hypothetical protein AVDCRST_MAG93-3048, partial [uncultured Chloroflexia bacterium]